MDTFGTIRFVLYREVVLFSYCSMQKGTSKRVLYRGFTWSNFSEVLYFLQ